MPDSTSITPDYTPWVGRSETRYDIASRSAAAGLAAVLDRPLTPDAAEQLRLFPLGHWLQFTPTEAMAELGDDGHPKLGEFMPPLDLSRRMWAGSNIEFHAPITTGQQLTRTTTIESITPKVGTSGRLCFVVLRHDISADNTLALVDRHTIVYREAAEVPSQEASPGRPPRADTPAPDGWDWVATHRPTETTLFRYSALTFNAHRIHYDLPYVTGTEGYPGLVVHGPLLATYVVDDFMRTHPGAQITSFSFSARAPIFSGEQVHVVGRTSPDGSEELAVINPDGQPSITARVQTAP